jgi:hypothetical protein
MALMAMRKDEVVTGNRKKLGVFKTTKEKTTVGGIAKPYKYIRESMDTAGYSKGKPKFELKKQEGTGDKVSAIKVVKEEKKEVLRKDVPSTLEYLKNKNK